MKGLHYVLLFTALTFLSWGVYAPLLRHGTLAMGHDGLKAFVGVGLAYFVIAVLVPFAILRQKGEKGSWTLSGTTYSFIAGSVGAIGALGVILALVFKGKPVYVMPLVFGFAPVVNTLVTAWMGKTLGQIRPIFVAGILAAALGAGGVMYFKPQPAPPVAHAPAAETRTPETPVSQTSTTETTADSTAPTAAPAAAASVHSPASDTRPDFLMIALSIAIAAVCWGSYGPMLHQGQMRMGGSRLRPFACVGLAYFIIAVAAPLLLIATVPSLSHGQWTSSGLTWSIIAGAAGALGALGIILAFNAGGKPIYVMPLVFGFAPVINTFISLTEDNAWSRVEPMFWVSLGVVIAGVITVLTQAPKAHHAPGPTTPLSSSSPATAQS